MSKRRKSVSIVFAILAACGGAPADTESTGNNTETRTDLGVEIEDNRTYSELIARASELNDDLQTLAIRAPTDLPRQGSADFEGILGGRISGGQMSGTRIAGELTLSAHFDTSGYTLRGEVTDLRNGRNIQYIGSLSITEGRGQRDTDQSRDPSFEAELYGTLRSPTGRRARFDAILEGDFYGRNVQSVAGAVAGNVSSGNSLGVFSGDFIATQRR